MFLRKKPNKSGSISIQIIVKRHGKFKVVKSIGSGGTEQEVEKLWFLGKQELGRLTNQSNLFESQQDFLLDKAMESLSNSHIRTIGPELVFGSIYDSIGYNQIDENLLRHLVIARLTFPLSKLITVEYLYRYQGISLNIDSVYRFLDRLNQKHKQFVEQISFHHTQQVLEGNLSIVFYDMTTLYFEASDEDDLRKTGFSKDGKHQNPQIFLGLLVGLGGYAIGYDIFEGDIYEGHTLIPFIKKISTRFNLGSLIIVADAGLLSNDNLKDLLSRGYQYIIGARIKNESAKLTERMHQQEWTNGMVIQIEKNSKENLIVAYSDRRAKKDQNNRQRGLNRLEKQIQKGKLTKANINNRGYNKYLKLEGSIQVEMDYEKFRADQKWDGLKGYVTNTRLTKNEVIDSYNNLWHFEKAFRISKTDLRIRPIFHRLRNRIEAHICISFMAYSIYKELERILKLEKSTISVKKAADLTLNIYEIQYQLPDSKKFKSRVLNMDQDQKELCRIINKYYRVSQK